MTTSVSATSTNAGLEDQRSCAEIIDELIEYVGGRDSVKVRKSATRALRAAIGRFNRVKAWKLGRVEGGAARTAAGQVFGCFGL